MTTRKELHKLVDELPDEYLADVRQFIRELKAEADEEPLSPDTVAAIEEGWEDFGGEETIRLDQLERE